MTKDRAYVVLTYARCGATYLAQLLGSTGRLGRPEDWFNGQGYRARGHDDYPLDRAAQLAMAHSHASENGYAAIKMSATRFDDLKGFDWTTSLEEIRFIHLVRENRLARAVSEAKARQTGQYRSTTAANGEARYDAALIGQCIAEQARDEGRIRQYFARNGIAPLELSYEQLFANQADVLARIAGFISIEGPVAADPSRIELATQRDATNEEWEQRFLDENRKLHRFDALAFDAPGRIVRWLRNLRT